MSFIHYHLFINDYSFGYYSFKSRLHHFSQIYQTVCPLTDEVIIKYQNTDAHIYTKFGFNDWPSKCYKQN